LQHRLEGIISRGWQDLALNAQEVHRWMDEPGQAMAGLVSWLDQCPMPPGNGPVRAG
jgi:hypothetical protein